MTEVRMEHISKSFGDKRVLSDFSLTVAPGETVCLMGRSGCGKTTLMNLLAGFLKPDSGRVTGVPRRVAAVFQEDRLCEAFTPLANLRLVLDRPPEPGELEGHLAALGLEAAAHKPVNTLSGGMKRRVAIARAMVYRGELVLLDEAFKGLDAETKRRTMDYVRRNTAGAAVVLVTHDREEADYFGGRLVELEAQE